MGQMRQLRRYLYLDHQGIQSLHDQLTQSKVIEITEATEKSAAVNSKRGLSLKLKAYIFGGNVEGT